MQRRRKGGGGGEVSRGPREKRKKKLHAFTSRRRDAARSSSAERWGRLPRTRGESIGEGKRNILLISYIVLGRGRSNDKGLLWRERRGKREGRSFLFIKRDIFEKEGKQKKRGSLNTQFRKKDAKQKNAHYREGGNGEKEG